MAAGRRDDSGWWVIGALFPRSRLVPAFAALLAVVLVLLGSDARAQVDAGDSADPDEGSRISDDVYQDVTDDAAPSALDVLRPRHLLNPFEYTLFWREGIRFERNDGLFRLKIGARLEGDVEYIDGDANMEAVFGDSGTYGDFRRAWLTLGGTIGRRFLYKLQVDLTGNSANDDGRSRYTRENYLGVADLGPFGTLKIGSVREPFTLNDTTSSHTLSFLERALPAVFAPSYNPGIVSENSALDRRIAWSYGVFYYPKYGNDGSGQIDIVGRITGLPIYGDEGERLLHIGASYSHQFRSDFELRYRRRPENRMSERYVDTGTFRSDGIDLFAVEVLGIRGSLSARAEVVLSHVQRTEGGQATFWGAYAEVAYILTGESRPYNRSRGVLRRLVPANPMTLEKAGWGLWEIAARYSYVDLTDDGTRGGIMGDLGLALNWYPRMHVRVMFNYIRAMRNGIGRSNIIGTRLALDF